MLFSFFFLNNLEILTLKPLITKINTMFDRSKYKRFARIQLKGRMGVPIMVTFIIFLLATPSRVSFYLSLGKKLDTGTGGLLIGVVTALLTAIISFAEIHLFLKMSVNSEAVSFTDFTDGLTLWLKAIGAAIYTGVLIFLWSLLLIVPGIIKSFAYSLTPFLLVEYPEMGITRAVKLSKIITNGHKMDIFITQLSFLGWFLLEILTLGLLSFWVNPYYKMTMTNVYHAILKDAVIRNVISEGDLNER